MLKVKYGRINQRIPSVCATVALVAQVWRAQSIGELDSCLMQLPTQVGIVQLINAADLSPAGRKSERVKKLDA